MQYLRRAGRAHGGAGAGGQAGHAEAVFEAWEVSYDAEDNQVLILYLNSTTSAVILHSMYSLTINKNLETL
jgi:hypothetical protein